jgi:hypothetical protein
MPIAQEVLDIQRLILLNNPCEVVLSERQDLKGGQ